MIKTDVLVIGGGPTGLCAAISAAESGARVTLVDRNPRAGGQLIKQTHMFFGSEKQYASTRGVDIAELLLARLAELSDRVSIMTRVTALGIYDDGVVTAMRGESEYIKFAPNAVIVATGASEKSLAFPNNDLPGIYGAGAVQTLMNLYGIRPAQRVLMVGAGNIGLIVSYQLLQAGVKVAAIVEAAPKIGGYLVHAAKVRRMGVPILTSHTVVRACGNDRLESAVICEVDDTFKPIEGTEQKIDCDTMCISVGLTPLCELLAMAGCEMKYIPALGGFVPKTNAQFGTTRKGVFAAGDVSGIEEASAAIIEGYACGIYACDYCGFTHPNRESRLAELSAQLDALRAGPAGAHIRKGIEELRK